MMTRFRKFWSLSKGDRRLLLRAVPLILGYRLLLWCLPFSSLKGLLAGGRSPVGVGPTNTSLEEGISWAVATAARYVPQATCLTQALATRALRRLEGLPGGALRLGVGKDARGRFQAHAWLEDQSRVLIGGDSKSCRVFDSLARSDLNTPGV